MGTGDVPEGLRVRPDGAWTVGDQHVVHPRTLRYLKSHLVFEEQGAFVVDGEVRRAVLVDGPAFQVTTLLIHLERGAATVVLDDGSEEPVPDEGLRMSSATGRFECPVRGGRGRAVLSRAAHQTLLAHAVDDGGFFLAVGERRFPILA